MRVLLFALLVANSPATQDATFRTGTRIVEIGIVAIHGDKPVTDLRQQDLRLYDNNREQRILSFEKVSATAADLTSLTDPRTQSKPGTERFTYILLDALNTSFSDQYYGREGVSKMLAGLSDGGKVEILALGDQLHVLHGFSSDYEELRYTVGKYEGEQPLNWTPKLNNEPIRLATPAESTFEGVRIQSTLQAIADIAADAKGRPGRKKLIWVSSCMPVQFTSRVGNEILPENFEHEIERDMRKLAGAGLGLYPVSPQGLKPAYADGMNLMAELTGGKSYMLSNDVAGLVRAAVDEPTENYLLTFAPPDDKDDGAFHEVRVATTRRGLDLRYRPGYIANYGAGNTPKKP